jgi:glycine betaine/proline transport system substrate-binding protein
MNHPRPKRYRFSTTRARPNALRFRARGLSMIDRFRTRASVGLVTSALTFVALAGVSCSGGTPAAAPAATTTIELVQSPWNASRIDAAIARILLTTQLGLKVNVTELDEYAQWAPIAAGTMHASLEVRPSGHRADIANYITTGRVAYAGPLGPIGKIGWYIPSYLLTLHPELATWNGFQTPAAVELFATPDTSPLGRFLAGDPSWTQYDADLMRNLDLSFRVDYAGSEEAELSALDEAYKIGGPILLYLWTPHWALTKYDLTEVALPAYSDTCWATVASHGDYCDYPPDQLFKIVWPGLAASAPKAYSFLTRFRYTTADQIALLTAVDGEGQSIDAAANAWIGANTAVWQTWFGGT